MAIPVQESPTGVLQGIGMPIRGGATDTVGAGGISPANGGAGIASMTAAAPATATAAEQLEHHENGNRLRSWGPEISRAPSDWRRRMERMMGQQAQELTQLHRTVGHLANLLETQAAREEAQWLGMMTRMQQREQKWDTHHEDEKLYRVSITNMIEMFTKGGAPRPGSERERKRQDSKDGWWRARSLTTCKYNSGRRTREAPTAAAATEAQSAAQTAA
jgi:hypothetical protein